MMTIRSTCVSAAVNRPRLPAVGLTIELYSFIYYIVLLFLALNFAISCLRSIRMYRYVYTLRYAVSYFSVTFPLHACHNRVTLSGHAHSLYRPAQRLE